MVVGLSAIMSAAKKHKWVVLSLEKKLEVLRLVDHSKFNVGGVK